MVLRLWYICVTTFLSVMRKKKAYRNTLSIILDELDIQLKEVKVEQVILNKTGQRAIRLDAWAVSLDERQLEGLELEDGATKIFLNMTSKNGSQELVSLLQYMKETRLDNPEILVKDKRIVELDEIVTEVKESEEWEGIRMNILDIAECERELLEQMKEGLNRSL